VRRQSAGAYSSEQGRLNKTNGNEKKTKTKTLNPLSKIKLGVRGIVCGPLELKGEFQFCKPSLLLLRMVARHLPPPPPPPN
jgi:hypothetical protein